MSDLVLNGGLLAIAAAVLAYLLYALLFPERF